MSVPSPPGHFGRELRRFLAAVQYFTRLPVPAWVGHSQAQLDGAARYFPAVGALVGSLGALALLAAHALWPTPVAVVLAMLTSALVTGAFHEDGLADAVDGLGGSFDRTRALEIMKDSRIGSFAALALILIFLVKYAALCSVAAPAGALLLIAGHTVSRATNVFLIRTLPYVRDEDRSRAKPLVQSVSIATVTVASATAIAALLPVGLRALAGLAGVVLVTFAWRRILVRRLGGYTGDCLGASQQIAECAFYLGCTASL